MPEEETPAMTATEKIAANREVFLNFLASAAEIVNDEGAHDGKLIKEITLFKDYFLFAHEDKAPTDD